MCLPNFKCTSVAYILVTPDHTSPTKGLRPGSMPTIIYHCRRGGSSKSDLVVLETPVLFRGIQTTLVTQVLVEVMKVPWQGTTVGVVVEVLERTLLPWL